MQAHHWGLRLGVRNVVFCHHLVGCCSKQAPCRPGELYLSEYWRSTVLTHRHADSAPHCAAVPLSAVQGWVVEDDICRLRHLECVQRTERVKRGMVLVESELALRQQAAQLHRVTAPTEHHKHTQRLLSFFPLSEW
jgi:hypothetical protein